MKFCCERFEFNYNCGIIFENGMAIKEVYPHIKIIKIQKNEFNERKKLYRYLLVCGFLKDKPPVILIKFCPFCGTNLYNFYTKDEYVNESAETFGI
jgi:hypothetical protein